MSLAPRSVFLTALAAAGVAPTTAAAGDDGATLWHVAVFRFAPAHRALAIDAFRKMRSASRTHRGNLSYDVFRSGLRNRVRSRMYVRSSPAIPRAVSLAQATRLFEMQWFTSRRKRDSRDEIALSLRRMLWGRTFALTFAEAACCKDRRRRE